MNAIACLCSFCEQHGPSVLFCTQTYFDPITEDPNGSEKKERPIKPWYGPAEIAELDKTTEGGLPRLKTDNCEGCTSMSAEKRGFISNDDEARISYVSSQYPLHPDVFSMVRQACVRSLSCEVCPGREGPIFFGDDVNGQVLSYTFNLKDNYARGFQSFYSIIFVMRDKIFLLHSFEFLVETFEKLVKELQEKATKVYEDERAGLGTSSSVRPNIGIFRRTQGNVKARSLVDITNDPHIFYILHMWFTWTLKVGSIRLVAKTVKGPMNEDIFSELEDSQEIVEGFIKVHVSKSGESTSSSGEVLEATSKSDTNQISPEQDGPTFKSLKELCQVLGKENFHILAFNTVVGNQVIIRCSYLQLVKSMISCLKEMIPRGCYQPIYYSVSYEDSWKCNFLGVLPDIKIPDHVNQSDLHIQVSITPKCPDVTPTALEDFEYVFHTTSQLPQKCPQVLMAMEKAIANPVFSGKALSLFLTSMKELWMSKVKVLFSYSRGGQRPSDDTSKLLTALGAFEHDKQLLKFWMAGLSTNYKTRILSSSVQQEASSDNKS